MFDILCSAQLPIRSDNNFSIDLPTSRLIFFFSQVKTSTSPMLHHGYFTAKASRRLV